jgi:phage shock protein C
MTKRSKYEDYNSWENVHETTEYREGSNHKKLRRNKIDGVFGGVCSGFGDYFGIDHTIMRILFILLVIFTFVPFFVYFILWVFIPKDTRAPYRREYRELRRAKRKHRDNPSEPLVRTTNFRDVKSKFRSLETRMQDLERNITSKEWKLRRDFRDLEN